MKSLLSVWSCSAILLVFGLFLSADSKLPLLSCWGNPIESVILSDAEMHGLIAGNCSHTSGLSTFCMPTAGIDCANRAGCRYANIPGAAAMLCYRVDTLPTGGCQAVAGSNTDCSTTWTGEWCARRFIGPYSILWGCYEGCTKKDIACSADPQVTVRVDPCRD